MTKNEKFEVMDTCYEITGIRIPSELFFDILTALDDSGYALTKKVTRKHTVIDLTPVGEDRFVLRTDLPMVLEKAAEFV